MVETDVKYEYIRVPVRAGSNLSADYSTAKKGVARLNWGDDELNSNEALAKEVIQVCVKTNPAIKEKLKGEY